MQVGWMEDMLKTLQLQWNVMESFTYQYPPSLEHVSPPEPGMDGQGHAL